MTAANIDCWTTCDLDNIAKHGESPRPVNRYPEMRATKIFPEYRGVRAGSDCPEADSEMDIDEYTGSLPVTFNSSTITNLGALPKGDYLDYVMEDMYGQYAGSLPVTFYASQNTPVGTIPKGECLDYVIEDVLRKSQRSLPASTKRNASPQYSDSFTVPTRLSTATASTDELHTTLTPSQSSAYDRSMPIFSPSLAAMPDCMVTNRDQSMPIEPSPVVAPFSAVSVSTDVLDPTIFTPVVFQVYDGSMYTSFVSVAATPDCCLTTMHQLTPIEPSLVVTPFSAVSVSTDTRYPTILTPFVFLAYDGSISTSFVSVAAMPDLGCTTVSTPATSVDVGTSRLVADERPVVHEPSDAPETLHAVLQTLDALAHPPQLVTPTIVDCR